MPEHLRYSWKLLRAGPIWLDGGGMFGIIPRAVWSKRVPCDTQGRIELAHNCLLLTPSPSQGEGGVRVEQGRIGESSLNPAAEPRASSPATRGIDTTLKPRHVLIETGSGDKFDEKHRRIFGLSDRSIINAVEETGVGCDAISHVIVSHLHFDHAGGVTRRSPAGPRPTFPSATVMVQQREWEDALANRSAMTRTYLPENLEPIADRGLPDRVAAAVSTPPRARAD